MRFRIPFLSLLLLIFVAAACDEPNQYDSEAISEELREQFEDAGEVFEDNQEDLQERLKEAEEAIREELETFESDDIITKEELEELRGRIQESADRIKEDLRDTDQDVETSMRNLGDALERIGAALKEDSDIEPIDHRKLRDLLPREVGGMERYNTDGSAKSVLGIHTSQVEANYESQTGDMSISIIDLGSISGAATVGLDLLNARIERDHEGGYERTTEIDGYPAFVSTEEKGRRQKHVAVIHVTDRFIVAIEAEGRDIDEDIIEEVVDRISLRRLARLGRR